MKKRTNRRKIVGRNYNRVMRIWVVFTFLILFFPIVSIILMSFNSSRYGTFPFEFSLQWYEELLSEKQLFSSVVYSFEFSLLVSTTSAIIGTCASIALLHLPKKVNAVFNYLSNIPAIIPWLVQGVALLSLFSFLDIGRSFASLFFGNLIAVMPHAFLLTYARVTTMDHCPEEAARMLGASPWRVFFDITLPMIFSAILSGWMMSLVLCFNCFTLQYYLAPFGTYTLPMQVYTLIRVGIKPDLNALTAIMVTFSIIMVILLNRVGFSAGQIFGNRRKKS